MTPPADGEEAMPGATTTKPAPQCTGGRLKPKGFNDLSRVPQDGSRALGNPQLQSSPQKMRPFAEKKSQFHHLPNPLELLTRQQIN